MSYVAFFIVTVRNLCQRKNGHGKWQPVQVLGHAQQNAERVTYTRSGHNFRDAAVVPAV